MGNVLGNRKTSLLFEYFFAIFVVPIPINMLLSNFSNFLLETGTDEAGRGCLAGPVTAAAVNTPPDFENVILNDSKQLSEKIREKLRPIIEDHAVFFCRNSFASQ